MKNLIFINGTMGAGKSAVSRELKKISRRRFFLDGDWRWDMEPFAPGEAERALVPHNIAFLLNYYLAFDGRGNVIFCRVMHRRSIVEDLLARLDLSDAMFFLFTLDASEEEFTQRLLRDVETGLRESGIVEQSLARGREFDAFGEVVATDGVSSAAAARAIVSPRYLAGHGFIRRGTRMEWRIKIFDGLTKRELYDILRMRSEVFGAEQSSPYNDVDGADLSALHLFAYDGETLAASMRVLPAGVTCDAPSLGRVAIAPAYRGRGLARAMMERGISLARAEFGDCALTIGAQVYLTEFYRSFGFVEISEPYDDAGVQHVDMRLELRGEGRV